MTINNGGIEEQSTVKHDIQNQHNSRVENKDWISKFIQSTGKYFDSTEKVVLSDVPKTTYHPGDVEMDEDNSIIQFTFSRHADCLCGGADACVRCNPNDYF
ncbi:hypothetical protein [Paenibacillus sp. FSL P4-0288]|uniref:hypothetical protein n=1 Tax=Paenibacillus sp. FSL P4-0288 TaxID=2921633 RepID=UPI0030F62006